MSATTSLYANESSMLPTWTIPRESTLSVGRTWNTAIDSVFYDVNALTPEEQAKLSIYASPEGSVLIVPPGGVGQAIKAATPWDFVQSYRANPDDVVDAIAVAGVGSSALGTAALARNVADHLGRAVAGIVSGCGVADVLTEALGGWFVLGARNVLRDSIARLFDLYEVRDHVRDSQTHQAMKETFQSSAIDTDRYIYGSPDSATLLYLMAMLGTNMRLVVGHSKGSLSIENALRGWLEACRKTGKPVNTKLCIVTLGAVIRFPSEFLNVHQFLGQMDYFGAVNSRVLVEHTVVPNSWHSLNSEVPGYLSVSEVLRSLDIR